MEKLIIGLNPTTTIEISADDPKELVQKASFWSCLPHSCPVCQKDLVFTYRTPKNFKYYGVRCTGTPSHATSFGVNMEGGGLYYKASAAWTVYAPGQSEDEQSSAANSPTVNHSNNHSAPTSENYQSQRDHELNDPNLAEPQAEIDRLRKRIAEIWHSKPRSRSYDAAIRERFKVSPENLRISQLRVVLDGLEKENTAAGANNGR